MTTGGGPYSGKRRIIAFRRAIVTTNGWEIFALQIGHSALCLTTFLMQSIHPECPQVNDVGSYIRLRQMQHLKSSCSDCDRRRGAGGSIASTIPALRSLSTPSLGEEAVNVIGSSRAPSVVEKGSGSAVETAKYFNPSGSEGFGPINIAGDSNMCGSQHCRR